MNLPDDFFTADLHLGHNNIIKYVDRPFSNIQEHDTYIINQWNDVVGDNSRVYVLGDFTLGGKAVACNFFAQLKGKIYVIGNHFHHDRHWLPPYPWFGDLPEMVSRTHYRITVVPPSYVIEYRALNNNQGYPLAVHLSHHPLAVWDRKHYGAWHLHGHSHGHYTARGKILDVGVDTHAFRPWSLAEIQSYMETR